MGKVFFITGLLLLTTFYSILLFAGSDEAVRLSREDCLVENMSVFFWLLGSILFFQTFFFSRSDDRIYLFKWKRNLFFLLLAIFFLFCCGEECSWGQRLIGYKTHEFIRIHNAQHEFNIHNMWIFQGYDHKMNPKTGFEKWLTCGRIFSLIWLFYCLLIPILNNFSHVSRKFIAKIQFPVIPVWIGVLFLSNYFISKLFEHTRFFPDTRPVIELKETLFALLYLLIAIKYFLILRKKPVKWGLINYVIYLIAKLKGIPLLSARFGKIIINKFLSMPFN